MNLYYAKHVHSSNLHLGSKTLFPFFQDTDGPGSTILSS